MPTLALLTSPLLGPSVWKPLTGALAARERPTFVCSAADPTTSGADVLAALDARLAAHAGGDRLVLVAHSNAGAYVAQLAHERAVAGVVLVDAILPPRRGRVPLAPPAFLELLRAKAGPDGLLPVWDDWWDDADVAALYPDDPTRRAVRAEQRRLPVAYFAGSVEAPDGWDDRPAAYLSFGDTYAEEREEAAGRGWAVRTLAGHHLHLLTAPDEVAATLVDLVDGLGLGG